MNGFQLVCLVCLASIASALDFYPGLVNSNVKSTTYLSSPATKLIATVDVSNDGDKPSDTYYLAIPQNLLANLSLIEVVDTKREDSLQVSLVEEKLKFAKGFKSDLKPSDCVFYSVALAKTLAPGETVSLKITKAFVSLLRPLPERIKKSGKQYAVYSGNKYWLSPYKSKKMNVKFSMGSDKIKSYSPKQGATVTGKKLSYAQMNDVAALSFAAFRAHYTAAFAWLEQTAYRDIEVSMFGNIGVEETFYLQNVGPVLKGPYEPGVMDRRFGSGDPSAVIDLKATLPKNAHVNSYTDRIGNISTSNFRSGAKSSVAKNSVLEIRPRYPLYGGWSCDFSIHYDQPSRDAIFFNPATGEHMLNLSLATPFREPVTKELYVTIALPEGAFDINIDSPYDLEKVEIGEDKRFTYLDTRVGGGRPLVKFSKKNVISSHNKYFQIYYKYDKNSIYTKPTIVIVGIFVFLITVAIMRRINPSLDNEEEELLRSKTLLSHAPEITHTGKKGSNSGGNNSSSSGSDSSAAASDFINDIDTVAADKSELYRQLKKAHNMVKNGGDDELKQKVADAYNKAKKSRDDRKKLVRIVEDLKLNI